jgi:hypothetical protein
MTGGLAVGLALGGTGISFAASSGSSSSSSTTPPNTPAKPGHGPRGFGLGLPGFGGFGGLGQVVYGKATVRTPSGGYQTIDFQVGSVTAVSSSSITVQSTDGSKEGHHIQSYTVTSKTIVNAQRDGIGSVKTGDQVRVIATESGSTSTATIIIDVSQLKSGWAGFGFGPLPGASRNHPAGASTPAAA